MLHASSAKEYYIRQLNSDAVQKFLSVHTNYTIGKRTFRILLLINISKLEMPPRVSKGEKPSNTIKMTPCNGTTCAQNRGQQIQNCFLDNTWLKQLLSFMVPFNNGKRRSPSLNMIFIDTRIRHKIICYDNGTFHQSP